MGTKGFFGISGNRDVVAGGKKLIADAVSLKIYT